METKEFHNKVLNTIHKLASEAYEYGGKDKQWTYGYLMNAEIELLKAFESF